jgi:hypothetical protein
MQKHNVSAKGKVLKSKFIGFLALISLLALLSSLALIPAANAYGKSNWQATFSGNCNNATHCGGTTSGFWGWCSFGGGTSTGGNNADCESSNYAHGSLCATLPPPGCIDVHISISGSAWDIEPSLFAPGVNDFFITAGYQTISGPTIVQALAQGLLNLPVPPCSIKGESITCPISVFELAGIYSPDTGIGAVPGHFSSNTCFDGISAPGCHYNQQVTLLP